jgi:hypothetical protein
VVLATIVSSGYRFVLFLHIAVSIVGFGAVTLNGLYAAEAKKRPGLGGLAITEANHRVSTIGEYCIYAVPILGLALVGMAGDNIIKFSDTWVWLALVLYVIALGVSHAVLIPSVKQIIGLQRELVVAGAPPAGAATGGPPPQVAQIEALGKRAAAAGMFLNLMLAVILLLMVFKPGSTAGRF